MRPASRSGVSRTVVQIHSRGQTATGALCQGPRLAATGTFAGRDGAGRHFHYTRRNGIIATGYIPPPGTDESWRVAYHLGPADRGGRRHEEWPPMAGDVVAMATNRSKRVSPSRRSRLTLVGSPHCTTQLSFGVSTGLAPQRQERASERIANTECVGAVSTSTVVTWSRTRRARRHESGGRKYTDSGILAFDHPNLRLGVAGTG